MLPNVRQKQRIKQQDLFFMEIISMYASADFFFRVHMYMRNPHTLNLLSFSINVRK